QKISSAVDVEEVLQLITREAASLMSAKLCSILLVDDEREWLDLKASVGAGRDYVSKPRLPIADSLLGVVVRRKKPMQVENVQTSSLYQHVALARREGLVSLLSAQLV